MCAVANSAAVPVGSDIVPYPPSRRRAAGRVYLRKDPSLIPADGSYRADYTDREGNFVGSKNIVAWDEDGRPLVVDNHGLSLAASTRYRFSGISRQPSPVVAAVPGGGWMIETTNEDGLTSTDPIVAWSIHADGTASPIGVDADGVSGDPTDGPGQYRIFHPDSTFPAPRNAQDDQPQGAK